MESKQLTIIEWLIALLIWILVFWAWESLIYAQECSPKWGCSIIQYEESVSKDDLTYLMRKSILQWQWRKEVNQNKYYTHEQIEAIASRIIVVSGIMDIPSLYILANLEVQSRFQYDAVSQTNDFGIAQLHCPKKGVCHRNPTRKEKERLFDPMLSIWLFGEWVSKFRSYCEGLKPTHPHFAKCKRNYVLTGIPGWIGVALRKTGKCIRKYKLWLRSRKPRRVI